MTSSRLGCCRLCETRDIELCDSHVVPRWAYKRAHEQRLQNPTPARISQGVAMQIPGQVSEYLLCSDCEQLLGRTDNYVSRQTTAVDGRARLSEALGPR